MASQSLGQPPATFVQAFGLSALGVRSLILLVRGPALVLIVLLGLLQNARAVALFEPPVRVTAELSADRAYIGDALLLRIVVEGSNTPQQPNLPTMSDFAASFMGGSDVSSHSVTIINGQRTDRSVQRYIFQYRLTPLRGGVLKLPAIPVVVDGQTYQTEPKVVAALEPKQTSDFRLSMKAAKTEAYVGEPVKVTIVWALSKDVRNYSFTMPGADGAFELLPGADPRPAGSIPSQPGMPAPADPRFAEVPFVDSTAVGVKGQTVIDGRTFITLTIERILVPRKDGTLTIGPVRAAFDAIVGQRRSNFFDSPFEDRSLTERVVIGAEPLVMKVKPLPMEGRPASFSGLIGAYSIEASASPTSVNVGDPITLNVTVRGPEPLDLVGPLALDRQRSMTERFKLPSETVFPKIGAGSAGFTYAIRARSDRVTEIPPIELPYFDTAAGEYRVARSTPIPLTVRPTTDVSLGNLMDEAEPVAVKERPAGLPAIRRGAGVLAQERLSFSEVLRSPAWVGVVAGPPAVYVLASIIVMARRRADRDPLGARRRRAVGRANRALGAAEKLPGDQVPAAVSAAVRRFVADLVGRPEHGMTAEECVAVIGADEPAKAGRMSDLLRRCESARFAPGGAAAVGPTLAAEAREVVSELAGSLRGPGRREAA